MVFLVVVALLSTSNDFCLFRPLITAMRIYGLTKDKKDTINIYKDNHRYKTLTRIDSWTGMPFMKICKNQDKDKDTTPRHLI